MLIKRDRAAIELKKMKYTMEGTRLQSLQTKDVLNEVF